MRSRRRLAAAVSLAAGLALLHAPSARADFSPNPVPDPPPRRDFGVHVITVVSGVAAQAVEQPVSADTGPPPVCVYGYADKPSQIAADKKAFPHGIPADERPAWPRPDHAADDGKGLFYEPSCATAATPAEIAAVGDWTGSHPQFVWVPTAGPFPAEVVTPLRLARIAAKKIHVPDLAIHTSPAGTAYAKLPTAVWVDPPPDPTKLTATASLDGGQATAQSETVTASVVQIRLIAPGATLTPAGGVCPGLGTPYDAASDDPPACAITWPTTSGQQPGHAFGATVQVVWEVRYSGGDVDGTTIPQQFTRVVAEIDSVNVGGA